MSQRIHLFEALLGHLRVPRISQLTGRGQVVTWSIGLLTSLLCVNLAWASDIPHLTVQATNEFPARSHDGAVQAIRQVVVAAQVAGVVEQLNVRAGDRVRAGQVLLRVDGRAAEQAATATTAQVQAARASLEVATQELHRKRQLREKNYIAQAALEQSEAAYRSAQAQVRALTAQAGAARTQTGFHVVKAPFDGVVADLSVEQGDMAMPGRMLMTVYDPQALRVTAAVPVTALGTQGVDTQRVRIQLNSTDALMTPARVQVLPTVDAASLTRQVRADLPAGMAGVVPGQFARLWLQGGQQAERLLVPRKAIVYRSELRGVYVLNEQGRPLLRQVRLGPMQGDQVEILSGLSGGERVVTEPGQIQAGRKKEGGAP